MSEIAVNGEMLLLDATGALYWPAMRMLILSDMHFEKGSSYARRGAMLPISGRQTLRGIRAFASHRCRLRRLRTIAAVSRPGMTHSCARDLRRGSNCWPAWARCSCGVQLCWVAK